MLCAETNSLSLNTSTRDKGRDERERENACQGCWKCFALIALRSASVIGCCLFFVSPFSLSPLPLPYLYLYLQRGLGECKWVSVKDSFLIPSVVTRTDLTSTSCCALEYPVTWISVCHSRASGRSNRAWMLLFTWGMCLSSFVTWGSWLDVCTIFSAFCIIVDSGTFILR